MESLTRFITQKLKLKVNETKSAVARPQERKFLGFSFSAGPEIKRIIAPKALERFSIASGKSHFGQRRQSGEDDSGASFVCEVGVAISASAKRLMC